MERAKKRRKRDEIDPNQFNFLNFDEAVLELKRIAEEGGYSDENLMLVDEGSNQAGSTPYIKHPPSQARSRQKLETNIRRNGGDLAWIHKHNWDKEEG